MNEQKCSTVNEEVCNTVNKPVCNTVNEQVRIFSSKPLNYFLGFDHQTTTIIRCATLCMRRCARLPSQLMEVDVVVMEVLAEVTELQRHLLADRYW